MDKRKTFIFHEKKLIIWHRLLEARQKYIEPSAELYDVTPHTNTEGRIGEMLEIHPIIPKSLLILGISLVLDIISSHTRIFKHLSEFRHIIWKNGYITSSTQPHSPYGTNSICAAPSINTGYVLEA